MTINFTALGPKEITPVNISKNVSKIQKDTPQSDTFETKTIDVKMGDYKIKCKPVKSVSIKDTEGNDTKALLVQSKATKGQYFIIKDDETLCRIFFADDGKNTYIYDLQGQNHKGKYKGAGCELIKTAIDASIKNGHNGKLSLCMADSLPFYFKCNFRIPKDEPNALKKNAFVDYMTRHPEFKTEDFMANAWQRMPNGECLDEKGAAAFLEDKRFIDDSTSKTLYNTSLKDDEGNIIEADIDFCDFSHDPSINKDNSCGTKIIQIINKEGKNGTTFPQMAYIGYDLAEDGTTDIKDIEIRTNDKTLKEQIKEELLKALELIKDEAL